MTKKRERTLSFAWVDAASLRENPNNWRTHPQQQLDGIRDAIREVGWAGALLNNKRTKIDGHARKKLFKGQGEVPVLIAPGPRSKRRRFSLRSIHWRHLPRR
jgi:hypothetical protein